MSHTGCVDFEDAYDNEMMRGTMKYGKFDKTTPEIAKETGKENYDMEMTFWAGQMTVHAVIVENGAKMIMNSLFDRNAKDLEEFYWISREDVDKLIEVIRNFITFLTYP